MGAIDVFKKEASHTFDDKWFIVFLVLTMLLTPLVVMSIMGSTFQEVVSDLDVIVLTENSSEYSEMVVQSIDSSEHFNTIDFNGTLDEAIERVGRDVSVLLYIPGGFDESLSNGETGEISLYLDNSDFIIFNFAEEKMGIVLENSTQGVMQIIVEKLEVEKTDKDAISLEVKNLADSLNNKLVNIENGLSDVDFDATMAVMDELDDAISGVKDDCGNCSFGSVNTQMSSIRENLEDLEDTLTGLDSSVGSSKATASDIQDKVDTLKLDLKALKNDFLSQPIASKENNVFDDTNYFEYLFPGIITASLFFLVFILTILNRIRKKEKDKKIGRLVQFNVLLIKSFIYILIGTFELIYILLLSKFVFHANVSISPLPVFVVLTLLAISSIGLGLVFSFIFRTERQTILLFPLIIVPLVLISETFSSLETLPGFFSKLALASPLYYSNLALREIMLKGSDLYDLLAPIGVLATYAIISITIGLIIFLFKRERKSASKKDKGSSKKKKTRSRR